MMGKTIKISQRELSAHLQAHPEEFQAVVAIWTRPEVIEAVKDLGLIVATIHREIAEAGHAEEIAAGQTIPFQDVADFNLAPFAVDPGGSEGLTRHEISGNGQLVSTHHIPWGS